MTSPTNAVEREAVTFPVCDPLRKLGCKHCISLFLLKGWDTRPTPRDDNATLTIIEFDGRLYGVTCQHVVDIVESRNQKACDYSFDFFTVINASYYLASNRFIQPKDEDGDRPDIAMRQLHPKFPSAVGKIPVTITDLPSDHKVEHLIAVGYPTAIKEEAAAGSRVTIPCVHAMAKEVTRSERRLQMFSILPENPGIDSFSGMSGGPVYWSTRNEYGLAGITFEAADPNEPGLVPDPRINILATTVSPKRFAYWASQVPVLY